MLVSALRICKPHFTESKRVCVIDQLPDSHELLYHLQTEGQVLCDGVPNYISGLPERTKTQEDHFLTLLALRYHRLSFIDL